MSISRFNQLSLDTASRRSSGPAFALQMEQFFQSLEQAGVRTRSSGASHVQGSASSSAVVSEQVPVYELARVSDLSNPNAGGGPHLHQHAQQPSGYSQSICSPAPAGNSEMGHRSQNAPQMHRNQTSSQMPPMYAPYAQTQSKFGPQHTNHAPNQPQVNSYNPSSQQVRPRLPIPPNHNALGSTRDLTSAEQHTAPMQVGHSRPPHAHSSDRRASHGAPANTSRPPGSLASAHPRGPDARSSPKASQSVSAPAPARSDPSYRPQNVVTSSSQNPLPTPPLSTPVTDSVPGSMDAITEASNMQSRQALEPLRKAMTDSLTAAHLMVTSNFAQMHTMLLKNEHQLQDARLQYSRLNDECARLRQERDAARKQCEEMDKQRGTALEDMRRMNENLPKLVLDYYQLKTAHAMLRQEMAALREVNLQLREKASATPIYQSSVRPSASSSTEQNTEQRTEGSVKSESPAMQGSLLAEEVHVVGEQTNSPQDPDAEVAFILAEAHEQRRKKQKADRDVEHLQAILKQSAALQEVTAGSSGSPAVYAPPTPTSLDPMHSVDHGTLPPLTAGQPATAAAAAASTEPENRFHSEAPKVEGFDDDAMLFAFPELGHADFSGELDIIDLTYECDSPMQLTADLPSLARRPDDEPLQERKRSVAQESNDADEDHPNKKRRVNDSSEETQQPIADPPAQEVPSTFNAASDEPPLSETLIHGAPRLTSTEAETIKAEEDASHLPPAPSATTEIIREPSRAQDDVPIPPEPASAPTLAPDPPTTPPPTLAPVQSDPAPAPPVLSAPSLPILSAPPPLPPPHVAPTPIAPSSVAGAFDGLNISLPSPSSAVHLPTDALLASAPAAPQQPKKIGVAHIPLIYEIANGKMHCRTCRARYKKFGTPPTVFDEATASWMDLAGHYEQEHPAACEKLVAMSPEQIRLKKQLLGSSATMAFNKKRNVTL